MRDVYFFDVPIYRLPEAKYDSDRHTYIERSMADLRYEHWPIADQLRSKLWKQYGGAWQFNEIIGYIRLYFCCNQIRGELWMTNAKRIVQTRRKQFAWTTWKVVPERGFPETASNLEIYIAILEYLRSAERQFKRRFIDTEMFARLGKYTDWNALLSDSRKRSAG
jgi:hypothetical protein